MSEEEVSFIAKYKDWVCVKRRSINEHTKPEEIIAVLASVSDTAMRKGFDLSGVNTAAIEAYAVQLTKGKRKGFGSLAEIFSQMKPTEVKAQLLKSCSDGKLLPIAEAFLMQSILATIGYSSSISPGILSSIYPELKIPKPKGRKPKG
jgi:hypothetical protein